MRTLSILAVLILLVSFASADFELMTGDRGPMIVKWKIGEYTITAHDDQYVLVSFPNGSGTLGDGAPSLPSEQVFVEIPRGIRADVEIIRAVTETVKLDKVIYPYQPCPTDTIGEQDIRRPFVIDQKIYSSDKAFPGTVAHINGHGIMRGRNLAKLRIYPFQYVPKTGELTVYTELELRINHPQTRETIADTDNAMDPIAKDLVLNFTAGRNEKTRGVEYLIITHDDYEVKVNEFANWKREQGFETKIVKLSSITDLRAPSASAIKAEVKKYYPGLVYLLLVGDANQIPLPTSARKDNDLRANRTPSDLCYVLLEGNDYYPEVYHGRIPANSVAEAETLFDKLLFYEKTPDTGNWYKRFLLCGEFQYQWGSKNTAERLFCETAYVINKNLGKMFTFPKDTIGTGSSGLGHNEYFFRQQTYRYKIKDAKGMNCRMPAEWAANIKSNTIARENTLAFWREGAFLVQHRDHGSNTSWGKPSLTRTDVQNLNNGNKLPVLFSINCLTGAIDNSSGDCFVEAALKNRNGGAVASIAASRVSYSWWNDTLCDGFYTCLFGRSNYDCMRDTSKPAPGQPKSSASLGVILNYGKMYLTVNYPDNPWNSNREEIEFYLFHCFGNPDMMIRTAAPTKLSVTHPASIASGDNAVSIQVNDGARSPVADAKVCFYQNGILAVTKTDANGEAKVSLNARSGDKVKLTITGHNLYPYQIELNVD